MGSNDFRDSHSTGCDAQQLFSSNYGALIDTCYKASGSLLLGDAERLVAGLAGRLGEFGGTTEREFLQWASDILTPAAKRIGTFYDLRQKNEKFVFAGIWAALEHDNAPNKYDDYEETVRELASEFWLYVFLNLDAILEPGTAKASTRLFALAKKHTGFWHKKQTIRHRAVVRDVYGLPSIEAAEQKASELDAEAAEMAALGQLEKEAAPESAEDAEPTPPGTEPLDETAAWYEAGSDRALDETSCHS